MGKALERAKELRADTSVHYNCAQSVVMPFAEKAGLPEETVRKMAANFGAGMKMGSTCGSVTGGLMVLGLTGRDDPETVGAFVRKIREQHDGHLDCATLLKINQEKGGQRKPHCDAMVFESVKALEEILGE